jgi:heat shock protein HtpX
MELCVDNPREGFVDLFATHPSVDDRIAALIDFAGGHDPGPIELALPPPEAEEPQPEETSAPSQLPPAQGAPEPGKPFLPEHSPLADPKPDQAGPWGPHRGG